MKKASIIKGTIILTLAGLFTRLIGFLYRIYLSNALGAEQLGVYQLIFPVYGICHTIYASGIQTSISKLTAEQNESPTSSHSVRILKCGLFFSVSLALIVSILLFFHADFIAVRFLNEAACAPSLRILSLVFPFCGITSCINGYCYGRNKSVIPATTQIAEQITRVLCVWLLALSLGDSKRATCELAVTGLVAGELVSNVISILFLFVSEQKSRQTNRAFCIKDKLFQRLLKLAVPLTLNRLLLNLLHSYEAIMVPFFLRHYGFSSSEALSKYGILNGMALPFIHFASAITNALAVLLLPSISEDDAHKNKARIASTVSRAVSCTLFLGILCTAVFFAFGKPLGLTVFGEVSAGTYICILSFLCPFLYLTTTLSSILNGLGKTAATFFTSMSGSVLRILLMYFLIPRYGMMGCFISLLFSQLLLCAMELLLVYYHTSFELNLYRALLLPCVTAFFGAFLSHRIYLLISSAILRDSLPLVLSCCAGFALFYFVILSVTGNLKQIIQL